jgi:hypothetical protein
MKPVDMVYSRDVVALHVYRLDQRSFTSVEEVGAWLDAATYELKTIPLPTVYAPDLLKGAVYEYAKQPTPFPAIVMGIHGEIADGSHRVAAAALKGDKCISAFVPIKPE